MARALPDLEPFQHQKKPAVAGLSHGPEVEATGPLTRRDASRGRIARAALSWFVARRRFGFVMGASEKKKPRRLQRYAIASP
jgi:hypothetical protein